VEEEGGWREEGGTTEAADEKRGWVEREEGTVTAEIPTPAPIPTL
jgi:hypothetical protein